jgi:hypothetical protein
MLIHIRDLKDDGVPTGWMPGIDRLEFERGKLRYLKGGMNFFSCLMLQGNMVIALKLITS